MVSNITISTGQRKIKVKVKTGKNNSYAVKVEKNFPKYRT